MSDPPIGISLNQQIACVEREIHMRRAVYPRQVTSKRMSQASALFEMAAMEAVLWTLKGIADGGAALVDRRDPGGLSAGAVAAEGDRVAASDPAAKGGRIYSPRVSQR